LLTSRHDYANIYLTKTKGQSVNMKKEDVEIRTTKILFAKNGNGYTTTRITLPVPWVKEMGFDDADRTATLKFDGKKIIINKEDFKMEGMIKELKEELLGKEITLLDMDNKCEEILESPTSIYEGDNLNSALDGTLDMGEETENGCICYRTMNENEEVKEIAVDFDILSKNYIEKMNEDSDYQFKILVKVTNIWII